jgi:hypothetical protein
MSRKKIALEFNSEIKGIFNKSSISIHDGLSYLLCLYYGTDPSYIPKELERKVLSTGIVTKDYSNDELKWNVGLFEETENVEWISDWMDMFKQVNPERRGVKADVLRRMKKFFVNNPSIRKEDVLEATRMYLKTIDNSIYCKKSHKFIYEQDGSSMLLDYVERIPKNRAVEQTYKDDVI